MIQFPAHHSATSIKKLFQNWPHDVRADQAIDKSFFERRGYEGDTPAEHVKLLTILGFIDAAGFPTAVWQRYSEEKNKNSILRREVRKCYQALFDHYPRPYRQQVVTVRNYLRIAAHASEATSERIERTFSYAMPNC